MGTISVWEDDKVLEIDGGDGCTNPGGLTPIELYA